jgi:shikimate kinase
MAKIYLIEGPVGAGKSTFGLSLSQQFHVPCLILDVWMANLFRPDRPERDVMTWYGERKERCIQQIWKIGCAAVDCGRGSASIF